MPQWPERCRPDRPAREPARPDRHRARPGRWQAAHGVEAERPDRAPALRDRARSRASTHAARPPGRRPALRYRRHAAFVDARAEASTRLSYRAESRAEAVDWAPRAAASRRCTPRDRSRTRWTRDACSRAKPFSMNGRGLHAIGYRIDANSRAGRHVNRTVGPDLDGGLDEVRHEVSAAGRHISGKDESWQCRQMQVMRPADPAFEHSAVPEGYSPVDG